MSTRWISSSPARHAAGQHEQADDRAAGQLAHHMTRSVKNAAVSVSANWIACGQ
jgi:hypothetical protein